MTNLDNLILISSSLFWVAVGIVAIAVIIITTTILLMFMFGEFEKYDK